MGALQDAVQGLAVMTGPLETMQAALQQNRVPAQWHAAGYPSLKPLGSWVADLVQRIAFFQARAAAVAAAAVARAP